jgi:hypothetical protein
MKAHFGKITAGILALVLLVGAFGVFSQPARAALTAVASSEWAAAPGDLKATNLTTTAPLTTAGTATLLTDTTGGAAGTALVLGAPAGLVADGVNVATGAISTVAAVATTTLVDAARAETTDVFTDKWLVITKTGAASEKDVRKITAYDVTTKTFTLDAATTGAVAIGDTYDVRDTKYKDKWVEVLTGPTAGESALITGQDLKAGTVSFGGGTGMNLTAAPGVGAAYRIVESRAARKVTLTVTDDAAAVVAATTYTVVLKNDASAFTKNYTVGKTAVAIAAPQGILAFDLVSKSAGLGRTVVPGAIAAGSTTTVVNVTHTEPADFWKGRTITIGADVRVITASAPGAPGTITLTQALGGAPAAAAAYTINIEEIPAFQEQTVGLSYGIFTRNVLSDKVGPIISAVAPKKGASLPRGTITFTADIIDTAAGFTSDATKIDDVLAAPADGKILLELLGTAVSPDDPGMKWTKIDNGWRMVYTASLGVADAEFVVDWRIIARDRAGAQTIQDHKSKTKDKLTVDGLKPDLVTANARQLDLKTRLGDKWDGSGVPGERWLLGPAGTVGINKAKKADRKSAVAVFVEAGGLDVGSLNPSDFTVNGIVPIAALVVDVLEDSKAAPDAVARRPQEVFLTMAADLPSDGKDTAGNAIKVAVTGEVKDVAGNVASFKSVDAADGIPPKLTVTSDKPFTLKELTLTVTSDETTGATPTLSIKAQATEVGGLGATAAAPIMTATGPRSYTVKISAADAATVPAINTPAKLNIVVTATDTNGTEGSAGDTASATSTKAITVEVDPVLNNGLNPEFTVAGTKMKTDGTFQVDPDAAKADEIEAVDPLLITVDFARQCLTTGALTCAGGGEKKEYEGDTHKTVAVTNLVVEVTLSDGSKVKPATTVSSADNIAWTLAISNPPTGEYTITFNAKDEAGNVSKVPGSTVGDLFKAEKIKIIAPKPVELKLNPGWNLISLPFDAANPAINSLIPSTHPVSLVMSYDSAKGLWLVSRRDPATGLFAGDVRALTANAGYFVYTNSLEPLKLLRPGLATAAAAPAAPPAIPVKAGWNLVPVRSNVVPLPKGIAADAYFGTLVTSTGTAAWLSALSWQPATQTWLTNRPAQVAFTSTAAFAAETFTDRCGTVSPVGTFTAAGQTVKAPVCIGEGLWVWATIDGVIIP